MKQDWRFAMGFFFNSGLFEICFMLVFLVVIAMFVVNAAESASGTKTIMPLNWR